jgi:hypothetical protein
MPIPRSETVIEGAEGVYHCISRCVRRAFLCGWDAYAGRDYEHRKEWVQGRLQFLSGQFAIDVFGYAVMSNHLHVVIRTRPDEVAGWDDEEVARRWLLLFPRNYNIDGKRRKARPEQVQALAANADKIAAYRKRLGSVSWFMRCLNEHIARRANREDECKGRFWEGRFKCHALLDDAAVLSCLAYVDLNPIREKIADRPEEACFTSAYDRIQTRQAKEQIRQLNSRKRTRPLTNDQKAMLDGARTAEKGDRWLCRLEDKPDAATRGALPMTLEEYLSLLDWSGRMLKNGKRGAVPAHLAPILTRLEIQTDEWLNSLNHFDSWFVRVAGKAEEITRAAHRAGRAFLKGMGASRKLFASPQADPGGGV